MKKSFTLLCVLILLTILFGCGNSQQQTDNASDPPQSMPNEDVIQPPEEEIVEYPPVPEALLAPAGGMLDTACGEYIIPEDDGSRIVSIYNFEDEETYTYDLTSAAAVSADPEIRLMRQWATGAIPVWSREVDDEADRAFFLGIAETVALSETGEMPSVDMDAVPLKLCIGDELYGIYRDGTVVSERGTGTADYFRVSALAFKYANESGQRVVFDYVRQNNPDETGYFPVVEDSVYRMCITGEGLHKDLDGVQANALLEGLFEGEQLLDCRYVPWDWEFPEEAVCIREYRSDLERSMHLWWLLPDGSVVLEGRNDLFYNYHIGGAEVIFSSWKRPLLIENAFSWDTLQYWLEQMP